MINDIKNPLSKCCNSMVLDVPKYRAYTMEDNINIKICSECKKEIK